MKVLGIYGSPRAGGNTDMMLDEALRGAREAGAEVTTLRACDLTISGCMECGGCDNVGACVLDDEMQRVYPMLNAADAIFLASPMFFYAVTAQVKTLMDRCQAMWCKRFMEKTPEQRKTYDGGKGYFLAAGATKGANLFEGAQLCVKYFYDALDMSYEGGVFAKKVEGKGEIEKQPEVLKEAYDLGYKAAGGQ